MGTSGTFGGSKNGLVPSWVGEPPSQPAAAPADGGDGAANGKGDGGQDNGNAAPANPTKYPPIPSVSPSSGLGPARGDVTRGARTSDSRAIRRGAAKYVGASGGGRAASNRMSNSRSVAGGIAGFARTFAEQGPVEALRRFNLEGMAGAPAEDVFVAMTDMLCPEGGTLDEAIARDAMLETVAAMATEGVGNFDELTAADLQEFFIGVVSRSIEGKILNEVGTNALSVASDIAGVERAQKMLHDFVNGCVRDRFDERGTNLENLDGANINGFVDDLFSAAFDLIQALGERE